MPSANWKEEIIKVASLWPREFRARLEGESWQLLGASESVQQELGQCAKRIQIELRFPVRDTDALTALLYRLKANGHYVWSKPKFKKRQAGSRIIVDRATIYPLGKALMRYVIDPDQHPKGKAGGGAASPGAGQAAAAKKNQIRSARLSIVAALLELGQPATQWPSMVREFHQRLGQEPEYRQEAVPDLFRAPDFDRLNRSPKDWSKVADQAWQLHRDTFLKRCQLWTQLGVDDEILPPPRTRGAGTGGVNHSGRANTALSTRYRWAAQYLSEVPVKEIAAQSGAHASTAGRIARQILAQAEWLQRRKPRRAAGLKAD